MTWRLKSSTTASGSPGLERVERRVGDGGGRDLVDVERGGEVGVDEADVHADDLRALALELDARGVGEAPGRGLRRRVGRRGSGMPTQDATDSTLTNAPPPLAASTGAKACVVEIRPR